MMGEKEATSADETHKKLMNANGEQNIYENIRRLTFAHFMVASSKPLICVSKQIKRQLQNFSCRRFFRSKAAAIRTVEICECTKRFVFWRSFNKQANARYDDGACRSSPRAVESSSVRARIATMRRNAKSSRRVLMTARSLARLLAVDCFQIRKLPRALHAKFRSHNFYLQSDDRKRDEKKCVNAKVCRRSPPPPLESTRTNR